MSETAFLVEDFQELLSAARFSAEKPYFFLDMIASLAPTPQGPSVYQLYWAKDFVSPFIRKQVFVASYPEQDHQ